MTGSRTRLVGRECTGEVIQLCAYAGFTFMNETTHSVELVENNNNAENHINRILSEFMFMRIVLASLDQSHLNKINHCEIMY